MFANIRHMKFYVFLTFFLFAFGSCHTSKKGTLLEKDNIENLALLPISLLQNQAYFFETFTAKLKINYSDGRSTIDFNGTLRMQHDSAIWISFYGPFGIEGARVLITKDSLLINNKLQNQTTRQTINAIQNVLPLNADFNTLQYYIMGYALPLRFSSVTIVDSLLGTEEWRADEATYRYTATLHQPSYTLTRSLLIDKLVKQQLSTTFETYEKVDSASIPMVRKIVAQQGAKEMRLEVEFYKIKTNQALAFPFE